VSKKNRQRRSPDKPASTPGESAGALGRQASSDDPDAVLGRLLASTWAAIAAGDPLDAELHAGACMAIPRVVAGVKPDEVDKFVNVIIDAARRKRDPEGAALLRLFMLFGSPGVKRAVSRALAELTNAGIYPSDWVNEAGKPAAVQAWRRYSVLGDDEAVVVTFSYGEAEHAIVVQVDLISVPMATHIAVYTDASTLIASMRIDDNPVERTEQIGLAEARRRLEPALTQTAMAPAAGISAEEITYLPLARSRIRRLPADGAPPVPEFSAADRAAAVDEFMKSQEAAEAAAADEGATRFWAEVLTSYSGRVPGEPPAQVGPRKLSAVLLGHVPDNYVISPAQRRHMEAAVTAWARWSVACRGLDEAALAQLTEELPELFARFDGIYADPASVSARAYVTGLSPADGKPDITWLGESVMRRSFAIPMLWQNDRQPGMDSLDAGDPAERRRYIEAEFAGCTPPDGMSHEQFMAVVHRVIEEVWHDEPATTWQQAQQLTSQGLSRHDIIHRLAV
jgi:hypothetical protein